MSSTSKVVVRRIAPVRGQASALETGELPPIERDPSRPLKRPRFRPIGLTVKVVAFAAIVYFIVLPLIPGFRSAATEITKVRPAFLVAGLLPAGGGVVLLLAADPLGAR